MLILKGRLSLLCPSCRRYLFGALRKQLLTVQGLMLVVMILVCAWIGGLEVPGGMPVKLLLLLVGILAVAALSEVASRWVSRPAILQYRTDRALEKEKAQEAARKEAARAANRKKKHKKK
jgi:hypothetical protein